MFAQIRPALVSLILLTALLGLAYPLAVTGIAQAAFPAQAEGSLLTGRSGKVVGSSLIGQNFAAPDYLHPRPSAAGSNGYDASASSGSNLGPLNPALAERVAASAKALQAEAPGRPVPADAVTTSGSGLDPEISPEYAAFQVPRIATARGAQPAEIQALVVRSTEPPLLGFIGQPRVNVLRFNLALDARWPRRQPPAP